jgi:hypothetical protein
LKCCGKKFLAKDVLEKRTRILEITVTSKHIERHKGTGEMETKASYFNSYFHMSSAVTLLFRYEAEMKHEALAE